VGPAARELNLRLVYVQSQKADELVPASRVLAAEGHVRNLVPRAQDHRRHAEHFGVPRRIAWYGRPRTNQIAVPNLHVTADQERL
jgi:hypothetical protein